MSASTVFRYISPSLGIIIYLGPRLYQLGLNVCAGPIIVSIIVSGALSWSQQCDTVCSKAYRALYVLRRNVHTTSSISIKKQLISLASQIFNQLLLSTLEV